MSLPSFLGPLSPIVAVAPAHGFGLLGGAGARALTFTMQTQQQTQWCWAATSASIDAFYGPAPGRSQCQVASGVLGTTCCASPSSATCNQPYFLDTALTWVGHLAQPYIIGTISLATVAPGTPSIEDEINGDRPIGCHISWSGGGGHFNAIYGYDTSTQDVDIADPFYSIHTIPYSVFQTSYQSTGSWDASYLTH